MAANTTGRTHFRFTRFLCDDSGGTPREIPISSLSAFGFVYDEADVTAWQEAVKNFLTGQADCPIEIGGPYDTSAVQAAGGSGVAPALSGSHTVLSAIAGLLVPLMLDIRIGQRQYWTTGESVFGITGTATNGFICTSYTVDMAAGTYASKFRLFAGSAAPAWGTAANT